MKTLVVDDSRAMRMIISRTLKKIGIKGADIVEASNGVEALEKIDSENPALVLSDWNMPEMLGIELLEKVRESGNEVAFGFITSESSVETKSLAIEKGASFLISKPFSSTSIEQALAPFMV